MGTKWRRPDCAVKREGGRMKGEQAISGEERSTARKLCLG